MKKGGVQGNGAFAKKGRREGTRWKGTGNASGRQKGRGHDSRTLRMIETKGDILGLPE